MRILVRGLGVCAAAAAVGLAGAGVAAAAVPFPVPPAPFGNPNGSFDVLPIRCATEVGERPGHLTVTGGLPDGWGCMLQAKVHWLNLSTGATGVAELSNGLNGIPPEATMQTGAGQVVVTVQSPEAGNVTPGLALVAVP